MVDSIKEIHLITNIIINFSPVFYLFSGWTFKTLWSSKNSFTTFEGTLWAAKVSSKNFWQWKWSARIYKTIVTKSSYELKSIVTEKKKTRFIISEELQKNQDENICSVFVWLPLFAFCWYNDLHLHSLDILLAANS